MYLRCEKKVDIAGSYELSVGSVYLAESFHPSTFEVKVKLSGLKYMYPIDWFSLASPDLWFSKGERGAKKLNKEGAK